jgi:hypothetical protein
MTASRFGTGCQQPVVSTAGQAHPATLLEPTSCARKRSKHQRIQITVTLNSLGRRRRARRQGVVPSPDPHKVSPFPCRKSQRSARAAMSPRRRAPRMRGAFAFGSVSLQDRCTENRRRGAAHASWPRKAEGRPDLRPKRPLGMRHAAGELRREDTRIRDEFDDNR